jgi:glyoxylate reductase
VVLARGLPAAGLALLTERFDVEQGLDHAPGAAAIVTDPSVPVDAEFLDFAGRSLKVVSNFGVGYDNFDLEALRARGLRATNTPDVLTNATAELAVALMLAAGRRIVEADALVRGGRWTGGGEEKLLGRELSGATVGLIGFGRIGRRVAELLRGFGARILYTSRHEAPASLGDERGELGDVLARSDFVSVHVALTPETRHLVGVDELARMGDGAVFVNTSRGAVVDTKALIEGLRAGRPAAAGLDVYEDEPQVPVDLRELPNTVLLPHVGSATASTRDAMARLCAENVIAVVEGREPPAAVI